MPFGMQSALHMLAPWLPDALVDQDARERIHGLASSLPPIWEWGVLECRLAPGRQQVDFMACVVADPHSRSATARSLSTQAPCLALESARSLLACWAEEDDPAVSRTPVIWLEYDLPPGITAPEPRVSLCLDSGLLHPGEPFSPAEQREIARRGLALLGDPQPEAVLDHLERCAETLGSTLTHVSSLRPCGSRYLRIAGCYAPIDDIPDTLDAIGWGGDPALVSTVLGIAGDGWRHAGIQFEIHDDVGPYLAVELDLIEDRQQSAIEHLCAALIERRIADPEKLQAALNWVGNDTIDPLDSPWLVNFRRQMYFKLVAHPDAQIEAKTYLGFLPKYAVI